MIDVYTYLLDYQSKSDDELKDCVKLYTTKFNEASNKHIRNYIYGSSKEYRCSTVKDMILEYRDLFYEGLFSLMELTNRKKTDINYYDYFNTDVLTTSLALFYLYSDDLDSEYLNALLDIELCKYILFNDDIISIIQRIEYLDTIFRDKTKSILPSIIEYLNKQSDIGKQIIMEYKLRKK